MAQKHENYAMESYTPRLANNNQSGWHNTRLTWRISSSLQQHCAPGVDDRFIDGCAHVAVVQRADVVSQ